MVYDPNPQQNACEKAALQDAGDETGDAGRGNKAMTPKSVGEMTGDTSKQAEEAFHVAKDDMAKAGDMGVPADRHNKG